MDDLISRSAAKEYLGCDENHKYSSMTMVEIAALLDEVPAVDTVHVVRCMECKYSEPCHETDQRVWCIKRGRSRANEWYCADGERKEDAHAAD